MAYVVPGWRDAGFDELTMRKVFISHAFSADAEANTRRVSAIARCCAIEGILPVAPQIYLGHFIDEATQRDLALRMCLALVALSDEVHVYGKLSEGMRLEIAEARRLGIPVVAGDAEAERALAATGGPPPMTTRGR